MQVNGRLELAWGMALCVNATMWDSGQFFFENIEEPYIGEPVGCECGIASCCLQYGFYALGLIPEIPEVPTYTEMVCGGREHLFRKK